MLLPAGSEAPRCEDEPMPWRPTFDDSLDSRLDPFRERAGRLTDDEGGQGWVYVTPWVIANRAGVTCGGSDGGRSSRFRLGTSLWMATVFRVTGSISVRSLRHRCATGRRGVASGSDATSGFRGLTPKNLAASVTRYSG